MSGALTPTADEMSAMIQAREEHRRTCDQNPAYDLSGYNIRLVCPCGWIYEIEAQQNDGE